jgi:integrase
MSKPQTSQVTMNTGGWDAWITGYLAALAAGGRPSSSRLLRRAQLRYLARTLGAGPAAVDAELLVGWLSARAPGWKHETLRSYVMAMRGFYRWAGELCSIALGGRWTLHTLRHRFGTAAYRGSHDLRAVQELLGHSSPATTQIYVAVNEDSLREAARAAQ